jgi:predicted dehydrogenase
MSTYRVGIIALGGISRAHMAGYATLPNVQVVAGADVSEAALAKFREQHPEVSLYADYHEMLARERLDVVSVCSWPGLHAPMVVAAAEAGVKGIACEKPMCLSLQEADQMLAACQKSGACLVVGHQRRYNLRYSQAKAALANGEIGELQEVQSLCRGDLFTDATHSLDLLRFFADDAPLTWLIGQVERKRGMSRFGHEVEDAALAFLQFESGVRGLVQVGDVSPRPAYQRIVLQGSKGRIEIGGDGEERWRILNDAQAGWVTHEVDQQSVGDPFGMYLADLLRVMEEGSDHPLKGESGRAALEIIVAIFESSRRRARVNLPVDVQGNLLQAMIAHGDL